MSAMTTIESCLTLPSDASVKSWRARLEGTVLTRWWSTGTGKEGRTTKTFPSEPDSIRAFEKAVQKKMKEGFVVSRDVKSASSGGVVLHLRVPNDSPADAFDLSPDGSTIAFGTMLKDAYGAELHLVDVTTGRVRLIHEEPHGAEQTFLHAVLFDASGTSLVYALNGETRRLDLSSGETRVLASYTVRGTNFNPFCVRPSWDGARERLLVFDEGDRVRVLGARDETLLEVPTASRFHECRSGALSRSGKLLALYRSSVGRRYVDLDETDWIEVWNVDDRKLLQKISLARQLRVIGFDPSETKLVFNDEYVRGPGELSIETGEELWHRNDPLLKEQWDTCYSWSYSPDGRVLAVGDRRLQWLDAATHAPAIVQPEDEQKVRQRVYRVVYSDDNSVVASGGDWGRLLVHKV